MDKQRNGSYFKSKTGLLLIITLLFAQMVNAQSRKQTNWLEDKKSHIARWRVGVGTHVGEPTGVNVQFYKLKGICTKTIRIKKMFSAELSISQEGLLFAKEIEKKNENWQKGGTRAGLDLKYYFPMGFSTPYLGIGGEVGTRNASNESSFSSDLVGRIGIEGKLFGVRTSAKSMLHGSVFIEGKYNYGLNSEFGYLVPMAGLRIHFL
jgi:hypothetical protein